MKNLGVVYFSFSTELSESPFAIRYSRVHNKRPHAYFFSKHFPTPLSPLLSKKVISKVDLKILEEVNIHV